MFICLALPLLFLIGGNCNSSDCPGGHRAAFGVGMDAQCSLFPPLVPPCRAALLGHRAGMQCEVLHGGTGAHLMVRDQRPLCALTLTSRVFFRAGYCDCVALGSALRSLSISNISNPTAVHPRGAGWKSPHQRILQSDGMGTFPP